MKSFIAALRNLVLPWGRTTGPRIVLNGDTGQIQVYDASNDLVIEISADPSQIVAGPAGGVQVKILSTGSVGQVEFPTNQPQEETTARIAAGVTNSGAANELLAFGVNGPTSDTDSIRYRQVFSSQALDGTTEAGISFVRRNDSTATEEGILVLRRLPGAAVNRAFVGGRLQVEVNADDPNSGLYVGIPATYAGNWFRVQKDGVDRLRYDPNGFFQLYRPNAADDVFGVGVEGDTFLRFNVEADGTIGMGSGSGATDVALRRTGVGEVDFDAQITTYDNNSFAAYTPSMGNTGTATFTTRTGWWQRVGQMIFFNAYIVVNAAGSGASGITISAPTDIDRTTRQTVFVQCANMSVGGVGSFEAAGGAVASAGGGASPTWNAIRVTKNSANSIVQNVLGNDLINGTTISLQGWYREG